MAVMPFMAVLCSGAFVGSLLICGTILTARKQWGVFFAVGSKIHKLGILSGVAHYGGNIIHTFATRNLSAVVAWPLGLTPAIFFSFLFSFVFHKVVLFRREWSKTVTSRMKWRFLPHNPFFCYVK